MPQLIPVPHNVLNIEVQGTIAKGTPRPVSVRTNAVVVSSAVKQVSNQITPLNC